MITISKDKSRSTETTYELRPLDEHGDAQDVYRHESLKAARDAAKLLRSPAWVIERHVCRRPAHTAAEPDVYTMVASGGEATALEEGGWI